MNTVVALRSDEAGELLTLQRAAYVTEAQAHGDLTLPPLTQTLPELVTELTDPEVTAIGIRSESLRLVASVRISISAVDRTVAELNRLIVAPDMQGKGLGSRLLSLVEDRLPAAVTTLQLFTGEYSSGNQRLYARFGYKETRRVATPAGYALVHFSKTLR